MILPRFFRSSFILSLLLLVFTASGRAEQVSGLPETVFPTLDQVLQQALSKSPRMVLRELDLRIARGDLLQAKSGLYPSVGGFYSQMETQDKREDLPGQTLDTSKTYYNVSLTQPVFHWGERRNNAKLGEIRASIARKQYGEAYRQLALEIRSAYLNLIGTKAHLASARFSRALADEALKSGEVRVAGGAIAEGEIFPLRIAAEQAALAVETHESNLIYAKQHYAVLTGLPEPADDEIPDSIPLLEHVRSDMDDMLASFLGQAEPMTPSTEIMRRQIDIEKLNYANTRKRLLPKLNFTVGLSQDEQSYTLNLAQKYGLQSKYVALQVNWSIFDGFATRGAVASALARRRQAEENFRQSIDNLQYQAQSAARNVKLAYRQMAINDRLLDSSLQFLNFRRDRFKEGAASEADVNNAQAGYNSALVSATGARQNYLMKVAEFVSMIARDPVMQHVQLN